MVNRVPELPKRGGNNLVKEGRGSKGAEAAR
jgi:hypothetical protein